MIFKNTLTQKSFFRIIFTLNLISLIFYIIIYSVGSQEDIQLPPLPPTALNVNPDEFALNEQLFEETRLGPGIVDFPPYNYGSEDQQDDDKEPQLDTKVKIEVGNAEYEESGSSEEGSYSSVAPRPSQRPSHLVIPLYTDVKYKHKNVVPISSASQLRPITNEGQVHYQVINPHVSIN